MVNQLDVPVTSQTGLAKAFVTVRSGSFSALGWPLELGVELGLLLGDILGNALGLALGEDFGLAVVGLALGEVFGLDVESFLPPVLVGGQPRRVLAVPQTSASKSSGSNVIHALFLIGTPVPHFLSPLSMVQEVIFHSGLSARVGPFFTPYPPVKGSEQDTCIRKDVPSGAVKVIVLPPLPSTQLPPQQSVTPSESVTHPSPSLFPCSVMLFANTNV
jgi:hypothetical protein